jgi:hypothetical protein
VDSTAAVVEAASTVAVAAEGSTVAAEDMVAVDIDSL